MATISANKVKSYYNANLASAVARRIRRSGYLYTPVFNRAVIYFGFTYAYIKESKNGNNINRNVWVNVQISHSTYLFSVPLQSVWEFANYATRTR